MPATNSGFAEGAGAKPIQAALASALSLSRSAPRCRRWRRFSPLETPSWRRSLPPRWSSCVALGALGAWAGGAPIIRPALRVGFWGALAMAVTAGIGALIGKAV